MVDMNKLLVIHFITVLLFVFSACHEKTEREWYSKEANVKLKICVKDSCDVFIINDFDSIFTKHNRIYYEGYSLHFIDGTDSLFFLDEYFKVLKVKQKNFIVSVYQPDTVNYSYDSSVILDKKGLTIQGGENGRFDLFINNEYKGEIPLVSMK